MASNVVETNFKSISCTGIPDSLFNREALIAHFSRFGRICKITLHRKRSACTVEYNTIEAAENALMEAGSLEGQRFNVEYTPTVKRRTPVNRQAPVSNDYSMDADVQAELDAMGRSGGQFAMQETTRRPPPPASSQMQFTNNEPPIRREPQRTKPSTITSATIEAPQKIDPNLLELIRRPAVTSDEKYRVLDARDKLIRLRTVKMVDINKVVSTKGTCPDMCPEKERLQRIAQHQVGTYEWEDESRSAMNHKLAVKQYSRSSADQESPLPHELRPEPVLRMTMDYLLVRIANLSENENISLADWFHFLWDRTRGIRKDITQQELCSLESVKLVEQCARFHIHCAGRLLAEDVTVCDPKINTENLTKCLQSLKYMYHDLGLRGVVCPNEAEFRAYVILLNLQDSNFLCDFKEYPQAIRHSPEVKFAIEVYLAMANSNYVRFFNLVRKTTYMNACVLLRYFTQMRNLALHIILKTYGTPKSPIRFPISNLTHILAFEDGETCTQYLEYNGLECDYVNSTVLMDRSVFDNPDMPYLMDRALNVVESKRTCTVGEAIYGGAFEGDFKFTTHVPHNSFGPDNVLLRSAYDSKDQSYGSEVSSYSDEVPQFDENSRGTGEFEQTFGTPVETTTNNIFGVRHEVDPSKRAPPIRRKQAERPEPNKLFGLKKENEPQPKLFGFVRNDPDSASSQFRERHSTSVFGKESQGSTIFGQRNESNQTLGAKSETSGNNLFGSNQYTINFNKSSNSDQAKTKDEIDKSLFKMPSIPAPKAGIFSSSSFSRSSPINESYSGQQTQYNNTPFGTTSSNHFTNNQTSSFNTTSSSSPKSIFANAVKNLSEKPTTKEVPSDFFTKHFTGIPKTQSTSSSTTDPSSFFRQEILNLPIASNNQIPVVTQVPPPSPEDPEIGIMRQKLLREMDNKRTRQDTINRIEKTSQHITDDLLNELVQESLDTYAALELQKFTADSQCIVDEIIEEYLLVVIDEYVVDEVSLMEAIEERNLLIMQRYFFRWKNAVCQTRHRRELMDSTPVWLVNEKLPKIAKGLEHPGQNSALMNMRRYRRGHATVAAKQCPRDVNRMNVFDLIGPILIDRVRKECSYLKSNIYWKAAISVPEDGEAMHGIKVFFDKYLKEAFLFDVKSNAAGCFLLDQRIPKGCSENVALCVRKFSGIDCLNEVGKKADTEMHALNALIVIATGADLKSARHRLRLMLFNSKATDPIPIVIIVYNSMSKNAMEMHEFFKLDELIELKYISKVTIHLFNDGKESFASLLHSSLSFCAENFKYDSLLEMQPTPVMLRTLLGDEHWKRVIATVQINNALKDATSDMAFCVQIHNENVERVIALISHDTEVYPQFPEELKCFVPDIEPGNNNPVEFEYFPKNPKSNNTQLETFLQRIKLKPPVGSTTLLNEMSFKDFIYNYTSTLRFDKDLHDKIARHCIAVSLQEINCINASNSFIDKLRQFSWVHCIQVIAIELLTQEYHRSAIDLPHNTIYNRFQFGELSRTPWWLSSKLPQLQKKSTQRRKSDRRVSLPEVEEKRPRYEKTSNSGFDLDKLIAKGWASVKKVDRNLQNIREMAKTTHVITTDFDRDIIEHDRRMRELKRSLQSVAKN